jgi:hypothetical protein
MIVDSFVARDAVGVCVCVSALVVRCVERGSTNTARYSCDAQTEQRNAIASE